MKKLSIVLLLAVVLLLGCTLSAQAEETPVSGSEPLNSLSANDAAPFIDNERWHETSSAGVTQMYNNDDTFVVMFFRHSCFNSNLRKVMVEKWMDAYGIDVYGVDSDIHGMPTWVWNELTGGATFPVIAIVENGKARCFTAEDSMRSINKQLQESFGIYDESAVDFSKLDNAIFSRYDKDAGRISVQYCQPAGGINPDIVAEAEAIVSGLTDDMDKLKAIYDWITENIYYHYGMLDGTTTPEVSAAYTYYYRWSICEGYANLTAAMCNAVGIPCRVVHGFATGVGTESTVSQVWAFYEKYLADNDLAAFRSSVSGYANHAWNEAYVNGKWVILDTTWGSNNDYYPELHGLIQGTPTDKYFDPAVDDIAESHLFWTDFSGGDEGDINILFVDYTGGAAEIGVPEEGSGDSGETVFTVSCEEACFVMYSIDSGATYTLLPATATDGGYSFTMDVARDTIVAITLIGDANLDGRVNTTDVTQIKRYIAGKRTFDPVNQIAANINRDDKVNTTDVTQIKRFIAKKRTFEW